MCLMSKSTNLMQSLAANPLLDKKDNTAKLINLVVSSFLDVFPHEK